MLAAGILGSACAAPLQSIELFTPGKDRARLLFHRRDNSLIRSVPATGAGISVNRADAPEAAYFDCQANPAREVPEFTKANFRGKVFLPPDQPVSSFNLRLADADGEVFQFRAALPKGDGKWHEIVFPIDASRPEAGRWGGGEKADGKLTMPVKFRGVTGDFGAAAGTFGIGRVVCDVLDSNAPVAPELLTGSGSPIHVLKAGEEEELTLRLRNPRSRRLSGVLKWSLAGVRGEPLGEAAERIGLEPGREKRLVLPRPAVFGVYKLNVELTDDDPAVRPYRKEMRFAYLIPAGPTPERNDGFVFGVCSHPQRHGIEEQRKEAMAAGWCGAKALREDIEWFRVQPAEGRWEFGSFDRVVETFGEYGVEVMPIFAYCTGWARAKEWKPLKPEFFHRERPDYGHWRKFVGTFAARYRDKVRYAEVWNEPDLYMFANFPENEYVRMLETAYDELKRVAPAWQVLCGGFACLPGQSGKAGNPAVMPAVIRSGKYDIFAFHGHGLFGGYRNQIERLPSYGNRKPWFANETAVSSMVHGEEVQAQTLFRKLIYSWAKGAVGYNWYDLRNDGDDPGNNEHNFGLLTRDIRPKAAYAAYNMLANHYRGAEFLRPLAFGNGVEAFLFRGRDGKLLLAVWSSDAGADGIPLRLAGVTGMAAEIDLFGNVTPLPVRRGELAFKAGRRPATVRVEADAAGLQPGGAFLRSGAEFTVTPGSESTVTPEFVNPTGRPLAVKLAWKTPAGVTVRDAVRSLRLKPGEARKVPVRLAVAETFTPPEREPAVLQLGLELGALWKGSVGWPLHPVVRLAQGVPRTPTFVLRDASQVIPFVPNVPDKAHLFWKNAADLSAEIRLGRDKEALLFEAAVTDDVHHQPYAGAEAWKGDNIQIAMKLPGQNGLWELGLSRLRDNSGEAFCWLAPAGFPVEKTAAAIRLETSRDERAKRTVYRAAIPFRAIGLTEAAARRGFRFNLIVNDNDGEMRESCIGIAPGIAEDKDPERYPTLVIP